ncbi:MAG: hypothetical protein KUG68_12385 [Flavobacteriaceae bacterium]|nr:hypothetical protein [Flavobacteriaceae bacterium]
MEINYTIGLLKSNTVKIFIGLLTCLVIFTQCKDEQLKMNYTYVDQNNNRYSINHLTIDYRPIKASESSSGTYDGGEEKKVSITEEEYSEITSIAEDFLSNKELENQKREMLTAILYSIDQHENKRKVILRSSEKRTLLEKILKEALKK